MIKALLRIEKGFEGLEARGLVVALLAMLGLAFFQVIMRNFFDSGYAWIDIVNRHLVLVIAFLGGALATAELRHLSIDVLSKFLPKQFVKPVQMALFLFAITVSYSLLVAAISFVKSEKEFGEHIIGAIPAWTFQLVIPIGFALILFHFVLRFLASFAPPQEKARQ